MKKLMKNNKGFTLMEMLMVMLIIAILILLVIPNITKSKESAENTGCKAYVETVQTQVISYELANNGDIPGNLDILANEGYITSTTCSDGTQIIMDSEGNVSANIPKN